MSRTGRQMRERTKRNLKATTTASAPGARRHRATTPRSSLRERLRYAFDNSMARGPSALVGWLAVLTLLLILVFTVIVLATRLAPEDEDGGRPGVFGQLFSTLTHALDPGTVAGDNTASWQFIATMLVLTLAGLFIVSALIGVIANGLDARLAELQRGRSRVLEENHTLILGWSDAVMTIVREISIANESRRRPAIVILAERDKVEMEEEVREKGGDLRGTRVVCRTGSPIDVGDLEIGGYASARSIIVLSPDGEDPDTEAIKTLLALSAGRSRDDDAPQRPRHVVVEIDDPANLAAARLVAGDDTVVLDKRRTIARLIVQTSRQSGAAVVYTELFDFDGDEVYFHADPSLADATYRDAVLAYEDCAVIGLAEADGSAVELNPTAGTTIEGRTIVVIASDDSVLANAEGRAGRVDEARIVARDPRPEPPSRVLVLGWNADADSVVTELDAYATPGSQLVVVSEFGAPGVPATEHLDVTVRIARTTDRAVLDELDAASFDQIIVLCYADDLDVQRADARTLVTLLHLREIVATAASKPAIVSEMLDDRNRVLAQVAEVDDVIVSDAIVSLMVSQLSEDARLEPVFSELLRAEGSEIYLRPAEEYVSPGAPTTFATIVEAALRRGETAIGYRRAALARDPEQSFGVRVNPPKSREFDPEAGDRVVVLAVD